MGVARRGGHRRDDLVYPFHRDDRLSPDSEVDYGSRLSGLSPLVANFGSSAALHLATRRRWGSAALGGALFGLAVSAMYYRGIQAFVAHGLLRWSQVYVAASVLLAVALGSLAFDRARGSGRFAGQWWATA